MSSLLSVHPEVWKKFPGMRILLVSGEGLVSTEPIEALSKEYAAAQDAITPEMVDHPHIKAWQEAYTFAGMNHNKFPCSVAAMTKRIAKGGRVPSINPLVDLYNTVSLRNCTPLGGFNLDELEGTKQLRLTREGETFLALGAQAPEPVPAGEVCYSDENDIITRQFVWRQSGKGAMSPETKRFVIVSEILGALPDELLETVRSELVDGLARHFGVQATSEVVQELEVSQ